MIQSNVSNLKTSKYWSLTNSNTFLVVKIPKKAFNVDVGCLSLSEMFYLNVKLKRTMG